MDEGTPHVTHVFLTGSLDGIESLRQALEEHDEVALVAGEGEAPTTVDVDVALVAVDGPSLPIDTLTHIRNRTGAPIVLLVPSSHAQLLDDALAADVSDVLLMPQPAEAVLFAIRKAARARPARSAPAGRGRIVTVFSPKGGTGKSVTSCNLAAALVACERKRTLLVDLDLQFGDTEIMLALDPRQTMYDLVTSPGALDADKLLGYTTRHETGLDVVVAPERPEQADLVAPERVGAVLDVAREVYEFVVVDTAPLLDGPVLAAIDRSDLVLLLATLEVPALKDVRRSLETFDLLRFPRDRIALVLNRANSDVGITPADAEAALDMRVRFPLPSDRCVPLSVNRGRPTLLAEPRSDFARAIRELAAEVATIPAASHAPAPREGVA